MWDLKPISIYTQYLQEKNYIFSMWDLKEKSYIFSIWDLKHISIYILCSQEKNYIFSMWDNKLFLFKYFNLKA